MGFFGFGFFTVPRVARACFENGANVTVTKFTRQAADLAAVYLYKEGLFLRAYNEGAYGFIQQIHACKPLRRFVKSAGVDRVVCGVPHTVLAALPGFAQATEVDALTWRWPLVNAVEPAQYAAWRESLPLQPAYAGTATAAAPIDPAQRLVDQLMQFNLAASTRRAQ